MERPRLPVYIGTVLALACPLVVVSLLRRQQRLAIVCLREGRLIFGDNAPCEWVICFSCSEGASSTWLDLMLSSWFTLRICIEHPLAVRYLSSKLHITEARVVVSVQSGSH